MYPFILLPDVKDYMWGGNRLRTEFGIKSDSDTIAEAWMLSCNPAGASTITNGAYTGQTLAEVLFSQLDGIGGSKNPMGTYFPLLIKLIDAKKDLSIQVHPKDGYALEHEGGLGKTEMWYILEADEGAQICYGFSRPISREEMRRRIEDNTLLDVINQVPVKKGDVFLIEAGTIHAIGKGILIAEIQQNSNTTYRAYDYNRKDANGNLRELHIEDALAVTDTSYVPGISPAPVYANEDGYAKACLAMCSFFTVFDLKIASHADLCCGMKSFQSLLFISGSARIYFPDTAAQDENYLVMIEAKKGMSIFLPAGMGKYRIEGECEVLLSEK